MRHTSFLKNIFPNKYITKVNASIAGPNPAMTLDIETYKDNVMHVYCASFFDGTETFNYYLTDFKNIDEMLAKLFKRIFSRKYRNSIVYIHDSRVLYLI